jgi:branched-chain amino acid transport system substrate-binding protein
MIVVIMNKKQLELILLGLIIVVLLSFAFVWCDRISPDDAGPNVDYERIAKSITVAAIAFVITRILYWVWVIPFEQKHQRSIPSIVKYGAGLLLLLITASFIITQIYNESALTLFIGIGASGLGVAYIAQDILKEFFAGISLAAQNKFHIGDWIKFSDGMIAQISKTRLTGIDLTLPNATLCIIPNTFLTNHSIINLNLPDASYYESVKLFLDHDVTIDRAKRIIYAASVNVDGIANKEIIVVAEEMQATGILFVVYFRIINFDALLETRHRVISSIITSLHKNKMQVSEIVGQLNVNNLSPGYIKQFNDTYVTDALSALELSGLFKDCPEDVQKKFSKEIQQIFFTRGDIICKQGTQGDSMFLIAEGAVEILVNIPITNGNNETTISKNRVSILSEGDYFGEMALLRGDVRSADIVAKTDVVIYEIRRDVMKAFIEKYPDIAQKLSTAMVDRHLATNLIKTDAEKQFAKKEAIMSEFMKAFKTLLVG